MRKDLLLITGLITAFLFSFSAAKAGRLDGLWQNDRQNITIRIEQDNNSFRAKRSDQGIWYNYVKQDDNVYTDRNGNWYEIINDDELEWNESRTNKRLIFRRVESQDANRWDDEDNANRNRDPRERTNRQWDTQDRNLIEGRWYDRSTKERLIIEAINVNGYRVRTQHGGWEQFAADRSGKRLRSRSGDVIQLIDSNKLRLITDRGRHESIFIRQGNGYQSDKQYNDDIHKDKAHKNKANKNKGHKEKGHKCDHKGKSCCG